MWFVYILSIVIVIIINYIIAKKFSDIAEIKGHEGGTYFWFTFIFGLVGMLMVIALPNEKDVRKQELPLAPLATQTIVTPKTEISTQTPKVNHSWRCDNCGKMATQSPCEHCGYGAEKENAPYWCGNCGHSGPYDDRCPKCNSTLKRFNVNKNQ